MTAPAVSHEHQLVGLVQELADLQEQHLGERPDWAHQTHEHLLLALGRVFTLDPRSHRPIGMPDRRCYENAALYASEMPDLMYAEGVALLNASDGQRIHLAHAWAVRPDGTVIEPTWDEPGLAYFGLPIADPSLWPHDGDGRPPQHLRQDPAAAPRRPPRRRPRGSRPTLGQNITGW